MTSPTPITAALPSASREPGAAGPLDLRLPALALVAWAAALLALLEIVFGVAWAWLGGKEAPAPHVLGGGLLVIAALAANEALALRQRLA